MSRPDGTTAEETRAPWTLEPRDRQLADVLTATLAHAREREYAGWGVEGGPGEGVAASLPVGRARLGGMARTLARHTSLDLRPLLFGSRRRSVGAVARFAVANQVATWLGRIDPTAVDAPDDTDHAAEAERLARWLREHARSDDRWSATGAGGAASDGNERDGDAADGAADVDLAATSMAVRALVRTVFIDADNADVARAAGVALVRDPEVLVESGAPGAPGRESGAVPVAAAALAARLLADLYGHLGASWLRESAEELLDHLADRQGNRGGWTVGRRPISNHHTGLVVEAFQRHEAVTGRRQYDGVLADALHFYQRTLFQPDGAPNAGPRESYPRTARAAAQGVVVFTAEGDYRFARHVLDWALEHLHAGDGRFYVRDRRLRPERRVSVGRSQAWMAYALAAYLRRRYVDAGEAGRSSSA